MFHNIGILAHVDSGKTTLTEQILYTTGVLRKAGSVDAGTTATDSMSIEKQRGISVRTSTASCIHCGCKINIIDTPGHVDFAGEVERSLLALDYGIVLISCVEGVKAHTENIINELDKAKLPYIIFINKIDRTGADVSRTINEITSTARRQTILMQECSGVETDTPSVSEISSSLFDASVTEALCDISSEAEEAYLSDTSLDHTRSVELFKDAIEKCEIIPVLCGSAKLGVGVKELLDFLTKYMPSSSTRQTNGLCGVIFKIEHDKSIGKIAHVRLFGGEISNRDELEIIPPNAPDGNTATESDAVEIEKAANPKEKVSQIRKFIGEKYVDSGKIQGGDIAALCGLSSAKTGHFIGGVGDFDTHRLVTPFLSVRVTPKDCEDDKLPRLAEALRQLSDEEPYINSRWENGQKEIVINTTGRIQIEIIESLLRERYGLDALFSPPTVIYKETPKKAGFAYADYTMPKPCWAVVKFYFEPMPRGYGVSYHGRLPANQCGYQYQAHIRKSFNSCLEQGLYGWEVTDFKCTLVGGEHHNVHTHPLDFFVCTPMAFMNGMASLGSKLLEPLLKMRISAPSDIYGKITGEIIRMGGEFDSPVINGDSLTIDAIVPAATSMEFPIKLSSWSSGKASVGTSFYGYRDCNDSVEHTSPRRGVNPLDRSKWILWARGAYQ